MKLNITFLVIASCMIMTLSLAPKFLGKSDRLTKQADGSYTQVANSTSTDTAEVYNSNWGCNADQTFNQFSGKCESNVGGTVSKSGKNIEMKNLVSPQIVENLGIFKYEEDKSAGAEAAKKKKF